MEIEPNYFSSFLGGKKDNTSKQLSRKSTSVVQYLLEAKIANPNNLQVSLCSVAPRNNFSQGPDLNGFYPCQARD